MNNTNIVVIENGVEVYKGDAGVVKVKVPLSLSELEKIIADKVKEDKQGK
jgi:hypothetical protein